MAESSKSEHYENLVAWALSGTYDGDRQVSRDEYPNGLPLLANSMYRSLSTLHNLRAPFRDGELQS